MRSIGSFLVAGAAIAALRGIGGEVVILSFGFLGMTQRGARTVERFRFVERDWSQRFDELEGGGVGSLAIDVVGLVADGIAPAAFHPVVIVVEHFLERAFVDHSLVALDTRSLFAFESFDRHGTELDSFHRLPRLLIAVEDLHAVEAGGGEGGNETFLGQRSRYAAAPKLEIALQV